MGDNSDHFHLEVIAPTENLNDWQGASGSPVFVNERIIGVIANGPQGFNARRFEAVPLFRLLENQRFRELVGFDSLPVHVPWPHGAALSNMLDDYLKTFDGRADQLTALDDYLRQSERSFGLLLAPTGRGKTALLIKWMVDVRAGSEWSVVFVPISRRYQTATADVVFGTLVRALAEFHEQPNSATPDQYRSVAAALLREAIPAGRRLLVVLDGLDEAVGWRIGPDLFPPAPDPSIRILASAREVADKVTADWLVELGWAHERTHLISLPPLPRKDTARILQRAGYQPGPSAGDAVLDEVFRIAQGDPLTTRYLAEGLTSGSVKPKDLQKLTPTLKSLVRMWLDQLREPRVSESAYELLRICAAAFGPLTADDVRQLGGDAFSRHTNLRDAVEQVRRFIIGQGTAENGYVFSHPRLREQFWEEMLSSEEQAELRKRFLSYGRVWYNNPKDPLPVYLRLYWIEHLVEANEWALLERVLTGVETDTGRQPWATARWAAEGSHTGYLANLDSLWRHGEQTGDIRLLLRCSLFAASVRSLSLHLPLRLLVKLATVGTPDGIWPVPVVLAHAQLMNQPDTLLELLEGGVDIPPKVLFEIAWAIPSRIGRATALAAALEKLPIERQAESKAAIRQELATVLSPASEGVSAFLGRLPRSFWSELAALIVAEPYPEIPFFKALPTAFKSEYGEELFRVAMAAESEYDRADLLLSSLPDWDGELLDRAYHAVRAMGNDSARIWATIHFANRQPESVRPALYAKAFLEFQSVVNDQTAEVWDKNDTAPLIAALARNVPMGYLEDAIKLFRCLKKHSGAEVALVASADRLSGLAKESAIEAAIEVARTVEGDANRAVTLAHLAKLLPESHRTTIWDEAYRIQMELCKDWEKQVALHVIADSAPLDRFDVVEHAAPGPYTVEILLRLACRSDLSIEEQRRLNGLAFQAHRIGDDLAWLTLVDRLAPYLDSNQLAWLSDAAVARRNPGFAACLQAHLLQKRRPEEYRAFLPQLLAAVQACPIERTRICALTALLKNDSIPFDLLLTILNIVEAEDPGIRESLVKVLTEREHGLNWPAAKLGRVRQLVEGIGEESIRVQALAILLPVCPPQEAASLRREIVHRLQSLSQPTVLATILSTLPPDDPAHDFAEVSWEAFQFSFRELGRLLGLMSETLSALVPYIPEVHLEDALELAYSVPIFGDFRVLLAVSKRYQPHNPPDPIEWAKGLTSPDNVLWLARFVISLPEDRRAEASAAVLESLKEEKKPDLAVMVLEAIANLLPAELIESALMDVVGIFNDPNDRMNVLVSLVGRLSARQLLDEWRKILNLSGEIKSWSKYLSLLSARMADAIDSGHLPLSEAINGLRETVRIFSTSRAVLADVLTEFVPWLVKLSVDDLTDSMAGAAVDVYGCWP
jgi:hypothetical protein